MFIPMTAGADFVLHSKLRPWILMRPQGPIGRPATSIRQNLLPLSTGRGWESPAFSLHFLPNV